MVAAKHWEKVSLESFAHVNMGQSPKGVYVNTEREGLPFYQGKAEFGKRYPTPYKYCTEPTKIAQKDDILLSVRAPVGPTNLCPEESCIGRGLAGIRAMEGLNQSYLLYYFKHIEPWLRQQGTGSTFKAISGAVLRNIDVLVPPLNEQIRIADKLDSLLAKLDAAQAQLDKIPTLLKRFRQSVLTAATSGELTREWREEQRSASWDHKRLIELVIGKPRNGKSPKGVDYETSVKNLTLTSITRGYFAESNFKYVDLDVPKDSYLWVKNGDILIQRANTIEYVGVSAIYEGEDDRYIYPDLIMKCRANDKVLAKYLHFSLLSEDVRSYFRENATGTAGNMPKINQTTVSNTPIKLPSLTEQKEIIRRVESLFVMADTVEKKYKDAKRRIDRLKQSILAKAFRGELTPQDPNDESASDLLKRIKAEQQIREASKANRNSAKRKKLSPKQPTKKTMKLTDAPDNFLLELLSKLGGEAPAEVLWKKSELCINDFYAKLKQEMESHGIIDDNISLDPSLRKLKVNKLKG